MKIDVTHIARLAHLRFSEDELAVLEKDMAALAEMVKELPECNGTGLLCAHDRIMELRQDVPEDDRFSPEELLANAPDLRLGCFAVPKTVE